MSETEVRESKIEKDVREYAESRGWWVSKFVSPGRRGPPDRLFIRKGVHIFIEIKKHGEEPTVQQHKFHREMRAHGATVYWVDSLAEAKAILA